MHGHKYENPQVQNTIFQIHLWVVGGGTRSLCSVSYSMDLDSINLCTKFEFWSAFVLLYTLNKSAFGGSYNFIIQSKVIGTHQYVLHLSIIRVWSITGHRLFYDSMPYGFGFHDGVTKVFYLIFYHPPSHQKVIRVQVFYFDFFFFIFALSNLNWNQESKWVETPLNVE